MTKLTPVQVEDIALAAGACDTDMLECAKRAISLAETMLKTAPITGEDLYMARYGKDGANWDANEHQYVWNDWAEELNKRLAARVK